MSRRRFTPAQANRTLPLVRRIVADILGKGLALKELASPEGSPNPPASQEALEEELGELVAELEKIGCYFKDWNFELGLVDFPAEIEGKPVLLCWRSDEKRVSNYHTYEAGYGGRRPIPAHLLEDEK